MSTSIIQYYSISEIAGLQQYCIVLQSSIPFCDCNTSNWRIFNPLTFYLLVNIPYVQSTLIYLSLFEQLLHVAFAICQTIFANIILAAHLEIHMFVTIDKA